MKPSIRKREPVKEWAQQNWESRGHRSQKKVKDGGVMSTSPTPLSIPRPRKRYQWRGFRKDINLTTAKTRGRTASGFISVISGGWKGDERVTEWTEGDTAQRTLQETGLQGDLTCSAESWRIVPQRTQVRLRAEHRGMGWKEVYT